MILALALAAVQPAAPAAQPAPVIAPGPIDPARLAAARELIDQLMPPATRAQMVEGMLTPMLANVRQGMTQSPSFAAALNADARVKALFDQFLTRQNARMLAQLRAALPGMTAAMANAYARRFDVAQLHELKAFFATPTGRAYMQASYTIMSDPDIAQWQRTLMAQSMGQVQGEVADLMKQVTALDPPVKTP